MMSGGILGVAGDVLSVAFLCFIFALALQLYCAMKRQTRPPTPLPCAMTTPPPQQLPAACNKLYLLRFQRRASCPVFSAVAPPPSPPDKLAPVCHVTPLACSFASEVSTAALAQLMLPQQVPVKEDMDDVDAEGFICMPPPRFLFTIKEESKDEDAMEVSNVANGSEQATEQSDVAAAAGGHADKVGESTCAHGGLLSQVSSASSDGGVSLWNSSPCSSSPAVSYVSASSSPLSPPRSSFWAHTSTKTRLSSATN